MIRSLFESGLCCSVPAILLVTLCLGGCTQEEPVKPSVPRPVKVETVTMRAPLGISLVGTVRAQGRADLSFETSGIVDKVLVLPGQQITKGKLLVQLDRQPAELKLAQAKAKLFAQKDVAQQSLKELERSKRLWAEGSVAQKDVEQSRSQYQSALAEQNIDDAALKLAQREYEQTQLRSPFNGRVLSRAVEQHTQVTAGQRVMEVIAEGYQDVIAMIPVDRAKGLVVGTDAEGYAGDHPGKAIALRLRSLAPEAKEGVLQEARFEIRSNESDLVDGANLNVVLPSAQDSAVITLPQQAFRGTPNGTGAEVFVYDASTKSVLKRSVEVAGMQEGRIVVRAGLAEGEQVVTAGSAFLTTHQEVTLFNPASGSSTE